MKTKLILTIAIGALIFTIIELVALGGWFHGSTPPIVFSPAGQMRLSVGIYVEHFVSILVGVVVGNVLAGKGLRLLS